MAVTTAYEQKAVTISSTEYSLVANSTSLTAITTPGVYQLFLDCNNLTATESYRLTIYETTHSTGTKRAVQEVVLTGVPDTPVYVTPALALLNGFDLTLQKLHGTDRAFDWSIRKAA